MRSSQFNLILDRVAQLYPKSMDLSLGRISSLLDKLGNPQNKIKNIIHIAGTNGKGSTLSYIVSILTQAGFKVDSYISPHLVEFNERFRIGNVGSFEYIDDESLIELLNYCERVNGKSPITIFELTTAAAFLKFSTTGSDFLILETGLGGRLDATNVIEKPLVSVITPIGLDHQQFLGNTLGDIAKEKAGIIKNGSATVISKQNYDLIGLFKKFIKLKNNKSKIYGEDYSIRINPTGFNYEDEKYNINLPNPSLVGGHQKFNAATAIAAISSIEDLKLDKPIIVAHSMGGHVSMIFGNKYRELCDEIILVDSTIVLPPEKAKEMSSRRPTVRLGVASPTKEDAIERFRLMPPQPCELDFVLKYVAETSYRETEEGWKLKSDPTIMKTYSYLDQHENLTNLNCKLSLIYGQLSQLMTQETLDYFKYVSGLSDDRLHMIPGAMHHLFLDKPKEFVDSLKQVLAS